MVGAWGSRKMFRTVAQNSSGRAWFTRCSHGVYGVAVLVESVFARNNERWTAEDDQHNPIAIQYNGITQAVGASALGAEKIYFVAPGMSHRV